MITAMLLMALAIFLSGLGFSFVVYTAALVHAVLFIPAKTGEDRIRILVASGSLLIGSLVLSGAAFSLMEAIAR